VQGLMQDFPLTLTHVFNRAEKLFGQKSIVTATATGLKETTYTQWAHATRRLVTALDELGVSEDGRVGTFAWNSAHHLQLYFGVPCSGRILHTLNIRLFPEQLVYSINHAEDEVLFVDRTLIAKLWPLAGKLPAVKHFIVMDDGSGDIPDDPRILSFEEVTSGTKPADLPPLDERRGAAMCYSSGTTGDPKGVVYTHRSILLHSLVCMGADGLGISENDVLLPVVPMFHVNAWGLPFAGVFAGSAFVFPGPNMTPEPLVKLIEEHDVTVAAGVPTIWMGVLGALDGHDVSSLRAIPCGGSAVPKSLSEGFRKKTGLPLLHAWGMTETSPVGSVCIVKSSLASKSDSELADLRTSQGIPVALVEARIADAESGEELPWDGEAFGELQVRGPFIAAGYYEDERSKDALTGDGWFRTGDVATIDPEGYIRIVDRTKDLVKSGGEWISTVELENELMSHSAIAEAAVIAVPHSKWQERPLACVVLKEGEEASKDELRAHLESRVAKFWLPDDYAFVDEIPKTSTGKFSKKDLREKFADHRLPTED
jgi:fatty-acyl-CoA synthase